MTIEVSTASDCVVASAFFGTFADRCSSIEGVSTMKMISNTNTISTNGVTLIVARTPRSLLPTSTLFAFWPFCLFERFCAENHIVDVCLAQDVQRLANCTEGGPGVGLQVHALFWKLRCFAQRRCAQIR